MIFNHLLSKKGDPPHLQVNVKQKWISRQILVI